MVLLVICKNEDQIIKKALKWSQDYAWIFRPSRVANSVVGDGILIQVAQWTRPCLKQPAQIQRLAYRLKFRLWQATT